MCTCPLHFSNLFEAFSFWHVCSLRSRPPGESQKTPDVAALGRAPTRDIQHAGETIAGAG